MKETNSPNRSLRRKPHRQLNLEQLCLDDRYCSTPGEQDVPGSGNSTTNETSTEGSEEASSPTLPSCDVDDKGNFGTGTQTFQVSFLYQVQTTLNQTVTKMEEDVLFVLENALVQQLLTNVFSGSLCSTGSVTVTDTLISQDQPDDGATVSGLSSEPRDTILSGVEGVKCRTPLVGNARRCFIVSGALTLLSQDDSLPLNWAEPYARVSTKQVMDNGVLNSVHPDVLDLAYIVEFNNNTVPVGNTNLSPTVAPVIGMKDISEENKMEPWAWVLISFGILGVVAALFAIRHRQKGQ